MTAEHYILWICLETKEDRQRKTLNPSDESKVTFALVEGNEPVAALAYCNLHGLLEASI